MTAVYTVSDFVTFNQKELFRVFLVTLFAAVIDSASVI